MEAAGFAFGIIGLVRLTTTCIRAFRTAAQLDKDHGVLKARLNVQRARFHEWARKSGLLRRDRLDRHLFDHCVDAAMHDTVQKVTLILGKIVYLEREGLRATTTKKGGKAATAQLSDLRVSRSREFPSQSGQEDREAWETTDSEPGDDDDQPRLVQTIAHTGAKLTSSERMKEFENLIDKLTKYVDRLERLTDKSRRRRRSQMEVDITELAMEGSSSGNPINKSTVEDVAQRQSATAAAVQSIVEACDRQLDVEGGESQQRTPSFAQRFHRSVREEIRTRPVSVSIASVASVTGVVSLARTFG